METLKCGNKTKQLYNMKLLDHKVFQMDILRGHIHQGISDLVLSKLLSKPGTIGSAPTARDHDRLLFFEGDSLTLQDVFKLIKFDLLIFD